MATQQQKTEILDINYVHAQTVRLHHTVGYMTWSHAEAGSRKPYVILHGKREI